MRLKVDAPEVRLSCLVLGLVTYGPLALIAVGCGVPAGSPIPRPVPVMESTQGADTTIESVGGSEAVSGTPSAEGEAGLRIENAAFHPEVIFADTATDVTVTAKISGAHIGRVGSISLVRLGDSGRQERTICELRDDGVEPDARPKDGIYSAAHRFTEPAPVEADHVRFVLVAAPAGEQAATKPATLKIARRLAQAELVLMDAALTLCQETFCEHLPEGHSEAVEAAIAKVVTLNGVTHARLNDTSTSIVITFSTGRQAFVLLHAACR